MFKPSQSLLKLIHHPLPLTPRESRQLLNLLTTSFRQQLDSEYPHLSSEPLRQLQDVPRLRRRSMPEPWKTTDGHMHSMLTNPLFSHSPSNRGSEPRTHRDPLETFDRATAAGMMDLNYACTLLNATKVAIVQTDILDIRDGMRNSGAGLKVLKWLISSGSTKNLDFLKDPQFAGLLLEFMVAEGLQEAAWRWISKSFESVPALSRHSPGVYGHKISRSQAYRKISRPLMYLIKAEASGPVCLDAAYLCLSRAAGYLIGLPTEEMRRVLGPPGWFLAHQTVMSGHPASSESSFESFLSLVPFISRDSDYYFAHLNLLHPTKPTEGLALKVLHALDTPNEVNASTPSQSQVQHMRDNQYIQLGLDTARFLLEADRHAEAEWVMELLRTKYSRKLGLRQSRELERAKAEAASLKMLEGLSYA